MEDRRLKSSRHLSPVPFSQLSSPRAYVALSPLVESAGIPLRRSSGFREFSVVFAPNAGQDVWCGLVTIGAGDGREGIDKGTSPAAGADDGTICRSGARRSPDAGSTGFRGPLHRRRDTLNGTTCTNGTSAAGLAYVADNPLYTSGNFTLRLDNHDVNAAAASGIELTDVNVGSNGTIILENGSDVVSTAGYGIYAEPLINNVTINVDSASTVTGASTGIFVIARGGDITVTTEADTTVNGNTGDGILALVAGGGDIRIDAQGTVSTVSGDGIFANANGTVQVNTGSEAVTAGASGITAVSDQSLVRVTTGTGAVFGATGAGIIATGDIVTIDVGGDVVGAGAEGIRAFARDGELNVTAAANTTIVGVDSFGISAITNNGNVNITTGANSAVIGLGNDGISASASLGIAVVRTNGIVIGDVHGIDALATGEVTVETARDVFGGDSGIVASSTSGGNVNIATGSADATAEIIGDSGDGINARTIAAGTITIDNGAGVFGSDQGIEALSGTGKITINNTGFVTATTFTAIDAKGGGFAEINNSGIVLGLVDLTPQGDSFNNVGGGVFEARGSSAFGGGVDSFANSGIVHAAGDPTVMEQVLFGGLEVFNNNNGGVISLVDGQAGDIISMSSDVPGASHTWAIRGGSPSMPISARMDWRTSCASTALPTERRLSMSMSSRRREPIRTAFRW